MSDGGEIRVVVYREQKKWVGQCLEYDIRAQADSFEHLLTHLDIAIGATRDDSLERHGKAFAHVDPAPAYFQELWEQRAGEVQPREPSGEAQLSLALCA